MQWLSTRKTLPLIFCSLPVSLVLAMPAQAKQAKCLFEVNDVHYVGAVCEFTSTNKNGSFHIADTTGAGIEAEVTVTAPGKGEASWMDLHGKTPKRTSLGEVQQAGACWSDGSIYVCAWSLDQDIYLGPRDRNLFVSYGERDGMEDEIESSVGLDTSHAVIHTKPSRRAAFYYTIGQHDYSKTAAEEVYQDRAQSENRTITADCPAKEWTGLNGIRYRFLGPMEKVNRSQFANGGGEIFAKWAVLDTQSNILVDNCGACSYYEIHDWYKKLCPSTAPGDW
jgi:hypothetical protein